MAGERRERRDEGTLEKLHINILSWLPGRAGALATQTSLLSCSFFLVVVENNWGKVLREFG